jgi:hypothetical protein
LLEKEDTVFAHVWQPLTAEEFCLAEGLKAEQCFLFNINSWLFLLMAKNKLF